MMVIDGWWCHDVDYAAQMPGTNRGGQLRGDSRTCVTACVRSERSNHEVLRRRVGRCERRVGRVGPGES